MTKSFILDHSKLLNNFIDLAIAEDIGDGDHTSLSCIPADSVGKARLIVKQSGILAGVEIAKMVFQHPTKMTIAIVAFIIAE